MKSSVTSISTWLGAMLIAGCGLISEKPDQTKDWSAGRLYSEAKGELADGSYEKSIKLFESLESRYPYGRYAQQAQLDIAYAYYKQGESVSAIGAADRFIKLHPNHPNVDYAYYLKGLANFRDDLGLFGALGSQDLSERDAKGSKEAFETFKDLVARFPDSKYASDAAKRMNYLVNTLAKNEVHVARYYYRRGAYVAAANRAQYAITTYPQAPAVEEALSLMVQSYDAMGLPELRDDAAKVLKKNFPNGAYASGARDSKSWWKFW